MYNSQVKQCWHFQYQGIDFSKAQLFLASVCPQRQKHSDLGLSEPFSEHPDFDAKCTPTSGDGNQTDFLNHRFLWLDPGSSECLKTPPAQ